MPIKETAGIIPIAGKINSNNVMNSNHQSSNSINMIKIDSKNINTQRGLEEIRLLDPEQIKQFLGLLQEELRKANYSTDKNSESINALYTALLSLKNQITPDGLQKIISNALDGTNNEFRTKIERIVNNSISGIQRDVQLLKESRTELERKNQVLEKKNTELEKKVNSLENMMQQMLTRLNDLENKMQKVDIINKDINDNLDGIRKNIYDDIDSVNKSIKWNVNLLNQNINAVNAKIDARIDAEIDAKIGDIKTEIGDIKTEIENIDNNLQTNIDVINDKVQTLQIGQKVHEEAINEIRNKIQGVVQEFTTNVDIINKGNKENKDQLILDLQKNFAKQIESIKNEYITKQEFKAFGDKTDAEQEAQNEAINEIQDKIQRVVQEFTTKVVEIKSDNVSDEEKKTQEINNLRQQFETNINTLKNEYITKQEFKAFGDKTDAEQKKQDLEIDSIKNDYLKKKDFTENVEAKLANYITRRKFQHDQVRQDNELMLQGSRINNNLRMLGDKLDDFEAKTNLNLENLKQGGKDAYVTAYVTIYDTQDIGEKRKNFLNEIKQQSSGRGIV